MRLRFQPWQLAALLALMCLAVVGGVYAIRGRPVTKPGDLVDYLPLRDATVLYIDVDSIRRSGLLDMIAGSKATQELEYQQFVDRTLFDYRQDLGAVAAAFRDGKAYFVLRGDFHWRNLRDYAIAEGGSCHNTYCSAPSSKPGHFISFYPIKPHLMALSVSTDETAAYAVRKNAGKLDVQPPAQPAWMIVPAAALNAPESLPPSVQPFAAALKSAKRIQIGMGPGNDGLQLEIKIACKDPIAASALLVELESATNSWRKARVRKTDVPSAADLSAVLMKGAFRREDDVVYGDWSVPRSLLDAVFNGSL